MKALLVAAALLAACNGDGEECRQSNDCEDNEACVGRLCVARLAAPASFAVELAPPADSPLARRDHPRVTFTPAPLALEVDRKVATKLQLNNPMLIPYTGPSSLRVVVTAPSEIPGREPLTFEADAADRGGPGQFDLTLDLPLRFLGRSARFAVSPAAPLSEHLAPAQVDAALAEGAQVTLPTMADSVPFDGRIVAMARYDVRLFVGERRVSNVGRVGEDGRFKLIAQKSLIDAGGPAVFQIAPSEPSAPPTVIEVPLEARARLDQLTIPPVPGPLPFAVPVLVRLSPGDTRPVAGATIRFVTQLESMPMVEARYERIGQTVTDGTATLALLPGTADATRNYSVRIIPPPQGEAGASCYQSYPLGPGIVGGTPVIPALILPAKALVEGQVKRANGKPAVGMRLRATRTANLVPDDPCGLLAAAGPSEHTTDGEGRYRLRLEPGAYRLELDPPPDSGLPRHALSDVVVEGDRQLDLALPEVVVIEGRVAPPLGDPAVANAALGRTEVRLYALTPEGQAGRLVGTALSGADGGFRLVVPRPEN